MEEGEEVYIPEDIKVEVLNRMFNSIQHRTQLRSTSALPTELTKEFVDSPSLLEQQPISSSPTPTPTPIPPLNEMNELRSAEGPPARVSQVVQASSIEELLQRGANMAESPIPTNYRSAIRPVEAAANAEDLENFLLHQAIMNSE